MNSDNRYAAKAGFQAFYREVGAHPDLQFSKDLSCVFYTELGITDVAGVLAFCEQHRYEATQIKKEGRSFLANRRHVPAEVGK